MTERHQGHPIAPVGLQLGSERVDRSVHPVRADYHHLVVGPGGRRRRPQHLDVGRKVQVVGEDPGPTGSGPEGRESRLVQADRRAVGQHHLAWRGTDQAGDLIADSPGQLKPAIVPPPDEPASPLDLEGFDHRGGRAE